MNKELTISLTLCFAIFLAAIPTDAGMGDAPPHTPMASPPPTPAASIEEQTPELSISISSSKAEPEVGEEVLITIAILNKGKDTAKNIRLEVSIPSSIVMDYVEGADKVREREEPKQTSKNRIMWGSITRSHELAFYDENLIPVGVTLGKYI
jgi:uncharacterized repeat protein (TIGR01451 family)